MLRAVGVRTPTYPRARLPETTDSRPSCCVPLGSAPLHILGLTHPRHQTSVRTATAEAVDAVEYRRLTSGI